MSNKRKHYKKMAMAMTKLVNHDQFPILMGQIDNWVKETRAKLTPEQLQRLDIMTGKKK
jgi:hypothetical protein